MKLNRINAPQPESELKFKIPSFDNFKLDNGIQTYFIHKKELPIINLSFILNTGSKSDPANKKGLSNLLSLCIDEGAGNYNALQLAEEFDLRGASYSIHINNDITTLGLQVLSEHFEDTLKLLTDIILTPHLNEEDFNRERRKISTRILQLQDEPDYIANSAFEYLLFSKENAYAYPVSGFPADLSTLNVTDVRNFYNDFFSQGNSAIVIAGSIDKERLKNLLNNNFGRWQNKFRQRDFSNPNIETKNQVFVIDKKNSVQTEIRSGHLTSKRNQDDFFKKLLLNHILGGQFTSRINLNLREKHGYTYGAYSRFNYYKDNAFFYVSTSVSTENTSLAMSEIFSELEGIRKGVTEEELIFAKSSITKKYPSNFETCGHLVSNLINKLLFNVPDDFFNSYIENIDNVSLEDVNQSAIKNIHPKNSITILVGNRKELEKQLTSDRFGEVIFLSYDGLFV